MVKGRKPKPTHLKMLEGNPGKRTLHQHEPVPRSVFPEKPVLTTEVASDCWDRAVVELEAMGVLHASDRDALEIYCEMFGTWRLAQTMVSTEGITVEGRDKNPVTNPAWRVARDAAGLVKSLGEAFGLTPAARSRLDLPGGDDDRLGEILRGNFP